MDDQINPFVFMNAAESAKASFEAMSDAYATWIKNANKLQAEAIRFVGERLDKDLQLLSRLGACKKPDEFLALQSDATSELVNDYLEEGKRWIALLSNPANNQAKAADTARPAAPGAKDA